MKAHAVIAIYAAASLLAGGNAFARAQQQDATSGPAVIEKAGHDAREQDEREGRSGVDQEEARPAPITPDEGTQSAPPLEDDDED